MAYTAKLIIPALDNKAYDLYVYRSRSANDIDSISKVANLTPVMVIKQSQAMTTNYHGKECYIVYDKPQNTNGITYNGPSINNIPIEEYETNINVININTYTFVSQLILSPMNLFHKQGIMFYYSVIGVDTNANLMTHLSKINGVLVKYTENKDITKEIWSCDDYNDNENDVWKIVGVKEYDELDDNISIGDINNDYEIQRYGYPFVETVPPITIDDISINSNTLVSNVYMTLTVKNPWQMNNSDYNYRKLKSYKIRSVYNNNYGEFSTPTFQSLLPVSIEKMIILMQTNPDDETAKLPPSATDNDDCQRFVIIRRDGIYYDKDIHKSLGCNKYLINLSENKLNVYSESSPHDNISIQIAGAIGNTYVFDIYLIDVYGKPSEPAHYVYHS